MMTSCLYINDPKNWFQIAEVNEEALKENNICCRDTGAVDWCWRAT